MNPDPWTGDTTACARPKQDKRPWYLANVGQNADEYLLDFCQWIEQQGSNRTPALFARDRNGSVFPPLAHNGTASPGGYSPG